MNVTTAFEFLKLDQSASLKEANLSYKRLLMQYHPDRNKDRSEWSHQMTVRLTEAYTAVTLYLASIQELTATPEKPEHPDSGYSISMQSRIGNLYDRVLSEINQYFTYGMDKLYLRQEGILRHRYRASLKRLAQVIEELEYTLQWPGSSLQHGQARAILDFSAGFYENMLIKPKPHCVYSGTEAKAQRYFNQGSIALDESICRGILELYNENGLICPGTRNKAEKNFLFLLTNYPKSSFVPETLIKLYLLKAFSGLCEYLEQALTSQ